jgi:Lrp/AsnC family transcriptional regulator, leucine-responsive regulatory protein
MPYSVSSSCSSQTCTLRIPNNISTHWIYTERSSLNSLSNEYDSDMTVDKTVDPTDLQILELLQANARETQVDIARSVGLAPSAVLERIRKLESRGIVSGYGAHLNPRALGLGMLAFVAVRTDEVASDNRIANALAQSPDVLEVHHIAGEDCYLIKVRARDAEHLGHLLRTRFGRIPGVRSTRTTIVLETVKETFKLPIPGREGV